MKLSRRLVLVLGCVASLLASQIGAAMAADVRVVRVADRCDPATFNAVLGEGACDPAFGGDVTFDEFIGTLIADPGKVLEQRKAGAWAFSRRDTHVDRGGVVLVESRGGEFHTFTEVAAFGGGCVEELNDLLGLEPADVCEDPDAFFGSLVAPGASVVLSDLDPGPHNFICLIHPWMRTTVTVR
jgi:hypothetical protein